MCGFAQDTTDNFDWKIGSGSTVTVGTGPSYDHTYRTSFGHYLYMDASDNSNEDSIARVDSLYFPASDADCLTFYYHITGDHVGKIVCSNHTVWFTDIHSMQIIVDCAV